MGVKANEAKDMPVGGVVTDGNTMQPLPPERPPGVTTIGSGEGMSGGQLALTGNYYF